MNEEPDLLGELDAMRTVIQTLQPLNDPARRRVLEWCAGKFSITLPKEAPGPKSESPMQLSPAVTEKTDTGTSLLGEDFVDLATFYHRCNPASDVERALVGSAWIQSVEGPDGLDSYRINRELKDLGYGVGNITRALDSLIASKPALVIQLRKTGTTKQARKTFRVTDAGYKRIRELIQQNAV